MPSHYPGGDDHSQDSRSTARRRLNPLADLDAQNYDEASHDAHRQSHGMYGDSRLDMRGKRLAAYIIDMFLVLLCLVPLIVAFFLGVPPSQQQKLNNNPGTFDPTLFNWGFLVTPVMLMLLQIVQVYKISTTGQSIGKQLVGVRIALYDGGGPAGFFHGWFVRTFVVSMIAAAPGIGGLFFVVDSCFIYRKDQRCIHDLIAGTKVVEA